MEKLATNFSAYTQTKWKPTQGDSIENLIEDYSND